MGDALKIDEGNCDLAYFVDKCSGVSLDIESTHHEYAQAMIYKMSVDKYPPVTVAGALYVLDPGRSIWIPTDADQLQVLVAENFDDKDHKHCKRTSDYRAISDQARALASRRDFFHDAPLGAALGNQFYRLDNAGQIVIEQLHPLHRQRYSIPVEPKAGPMPLFTQYLKDAFAGEDEAGQVRLLQEIAGAVICGLMARHQRAVLQLGFGATGKTTWSNIILGTVPPAFHCAVSPFDWDNEYYRARLAGKRINAVGELPEDKFIPAAAFKDVLGGDSIGGRFAYGHPFDFYPEAAHLFNANHLINTRDRSSAFFRRWLILHYANPVAPDKQNKTLSKRIVVEELPAVLAWCIEGAQRVVKNDGFTMTATHEEYMSRWQHMSDSVLAFIAESGKVFKCDDAGYISRATFYRKYREWCIDEDRRPLGKTKCFIRMEDPLITGMGIRKAILQGTPIYRGLTERMPWDC